MNYFKYIYTGIKPLLSIHSFLQTIFFNLYYLPFRQAIRLTIWIYKPHFHKLKGKIRLELGENNIHPGMIRLGFMGGHMYPNRGIDWTHEGIIVFKGTCRIGNNSFIVTGPQSEVVFGDDFINSTTLRLISFIKIDFGKHCRVGFDCMVMDTNFHPMYDMIKEKFKKAYGPIFLANNNWIASQCFVMPGVKTVPYCTFGARSIVCRGIEFEPYCVYGGSPLHIISRNVKIIIGQDTISKYE